MSTRIKIKTLLSALMIVISLHIITLLNKTYNLPDRSFSSEQYKTMIAAMDVHTRIQITYRSTIQYFGILPERTVNCFYIAYIIIASLFLFKINREGFVSSINSEYTKSI